MVKTDFIDTILHYGEPINKWVLENWLWILLGIAGLLIFFALRKFGVV